MAYIEFRPLLNGDGEEELSVSAYSDQEAEERFGDELEALITREPERGFCTLRRVDWTEDELATFNEKVRAFNAMIWDVVTACGLA